MSEHDAAFRYGNFEVLARADGTAELLGGGSFGKTYKARHIFLDQIVALKVISEKFAHDKNAKERFLREARVVHGLRHPTSPRPALVAPADIEGPDPGATLAYEALPPSARVEGKYRLGDKIGRSSLGNIYRATQVSDDAPLSVTVLDDALRESPARMETLRRAVAQAAQAPHDSICRVYGPETFDDAEVLVREWTTGLSLQDIVKNRGSIPFVEAALPLRLIANGVDFAAAAGLHGVRLAPDEIYLQPADGSREFPDAAALKSTSLRQWPAFRIRLMPILLEDEAASDVSMTLAAQSHGSPRVEYGSLLYRLVAGMQVKFAARVNRGAYIRTSGLSEEGNWILSSCIVDEAAGGSGCVEVLQALQRAEGVNDHDSAIPATPRQPGSTTGSPLQTGGATRSNPLPPPAPAQTAKPPPPSPAAPVPEQVAAPPPIPKPVPPSRDAAPYVEAESTKKRSALVPILVGLAVAGVVLGGVAALLLRSRPSSDALAHASPPPAPTGAVETPKPTAVPVMMVTPEPATPKPTMPATPPPAFVLHDGARLTTASYELGGRPITPQRQGGDLVFPLDGLGDATGDLTIKVPGFKPSHLNVAAGNSGELPTSTDRDTAPVYLSLKSRDTDYSYLQFTFTEPLVGEDVKGPARDTTLSLRNASSQTSINLPTGKYDYRLFGASLQDEHILPLRGSVTVSTLGRAELPVPASFVGKYTAEFDDADANLHVARTVVVDPGLNGGHVNDARFRNLVALGSPLNNVPLAEMHLDAHGVLVALIRYAALPGVKQQSYDEVIELRHNPGGELVMTGGREAVPNDPVMRANLEARFKRKPVTKDRPGEIPLRTSD